MPLLNYTTTIDVGKSVGEVTAMLAKAGADQVLTQYRAGEAIGLAFTLPTSTGPRQYRLPVDPDPVLRVLRKERVQPRYQSTEHAARVAWRITKDWIEAQLAIIATGMVSNDQVFLPYMLVDGGEQTVFDRYRAQQLELTSGEVIRDG